MSVENNDKKDDHEKSKVSPERKIPSPGEIQSEFEKLIKDKFGGQVRFQTQVAGMPNRPMDPSEPAVGVGEKKTKKPIELRFNYKPKEVKEFLDKNVIHQDEAKKALAIAICDHYNHVTDCLKNPTESKLDYAKQNVLMLGPTGVGKTYLVRQIADLIGVPFVKADATRFSETGYVGANVDDLIRDLVSQADGDMELAQFGIIYLDEADKLAGGGQMRGKDISGRGVQFGLLKLMEETEVDLRASNDMASQMKAFMDMQTKGKIEKEVINTRHILFIVSGAFTGLSEIVDRRISKGSLGIGGELKQDKSETHLFREVATQDFIEYGFEPEFVGRLPVRVVCHELSEKDLFEILKYSGGSIIRQYKRAFRAYGIEANFTDEGLQEIAYKAHKEKTGARGLVTVLESLFRDFKFELPSRNVTSISVDRDFVKNPVDTLKKILSNSKEVPNLKKFSDVEEFSNDYFEKFGMTLNFTLEAKEELLKRSLKAQSSVSDWGFKHFEAFEHGLSLIKQNTGKTQFLVDLDVIEKPNQTLESWIKDSYSKH